MSNRVPGLSQDMHRALWTEFVRKTFQRTNRKVAFNGKLRNVFEGRIPTASAGTVFLVLDEYHGDLEVLDDKAKHLGSVELDISHDRVVTLGRFKPGSTHHYQWV